MTSAIPAVIDALLADAADAAALAGVQILDGPPAGQDLQDQYVIIGWSQNQPSTAATQDTDTFDEAGTETFQIPCQARSYSGNTDMAARRTAVFALYDAVAGVADDLAPSGVNAAAGASVVTYTPRQLTTGAEAEVQFSITVTVLD
jgi:hypothetical protein